MDTKKQIDNIKESQNIKKELALFFDQRDKASRGNTGLSKNNTEVLSEEIGIKNSKYEESLKVDAIPCYVKPMFGSVFLTARRNKTMDGELYLPTAAFGGGADTDMDQDFSDKQIVLATGPNVQQVSEGDEVVLNMDNFRVRKDQTMAQKVRKEHTFLLPIEVIDGVEYLYVSERDIKYISRKDIRGTDIQ